MRRILLIALCELLLPLGHLLAQRLPNNVVPESYDLRFEPDLAKADFEGEETIHVRMLSPANVVVLNEAEIQFKEATVTAGGLTQTANIEADEKIEQVKFTFPHAIPAGPADIHIRYSGILNDKLRGFYLSTTARRRYAVTQFEATDARRAFPSFDEPSYKAVFRISLVIDTGDTAISNGRLVSDTPGPGNKHTLQFSPTPKMSTYLVAMMLGDFQCLEGSADDIPIRVCAVPEKKELGAYALVATENILRYFDRYYYAKYPFEKLDIVAFPDFSAGAMENTGAITYRETLLLIDDKTASIDSHELVASVLAHEIAHEWFGDLVTMRWWDDIWLNEGFATWMSWKPLESWNPAWHAERGEIQETVQSLYTDSVASIRPIRQKAETRAEIDNLFDGIAYGKAASVLRMVEEYLGPDAFREGVNEYLKKHAYENASAEDFWNQLTATSGKPVDRIMAGFIDQPGAPLVSVESTCKNDRTVVTLSQTRYFADPERLARGSPEVWEIPIFLRTAASKESTVKILTKRRESFELQGCSPWIYANAGGRGYYRTEYTPREYSKIIAELETSFSPEERIRFLDDAWALVRVGRLNIGEYLAALEKMRSEQVRAVVQTMLQNIAEIHDNVVGSGDRPAFEAWVRSFLLPLSQELENESAKGDPKERQAFRDDVFAILAIYGRDPASINKSRAAVETYFNDANSNKPPLDVKFLLIAARNGDTNLYQECRNQLKKARTPGEYYPCFAAIGLFTDPELTKKTFDFVLSPEVRNQDMNILSAMIANPETRSTAWDSYKSRFTEIQAKLGESLGSSALGFMSSFCDEQLRDESQTFLQSKHIAGTERIFRNARDQVDACIELRLLQRDNLSSYLKK